MVHAPSRQALSCALQRPPIRSVLCTVFALSLASQRPAALAIRTCYNSAAPVQPNTWESA